MSIMHAFQKSLFLWGRFPSPNHHGQSLLEAVAVISILWIFMGFLLGVLFLGSAKSTADLLLHEALLCADIENSALRCQWKCQEDLKSKLLFLSSARVQIQDQGFQWKGSIDFKIPWAWNTHVHFDRTLTKDLL